MFQQFSLDWVEAFGIGGPNEECNAFHLMITCESGKVPCMAELKKKIGKNIVFYVEFIPGVEEGFQYLANERSDNESPSNPTSGDGIYIEGDSVERYGTVCIFGFTFNEEKKHFALTCYHVCYGQRLPDNKAKAHKTLTKDSRNKKSFTRSSKFCYRARQMHEEVEGHDKNHNGGQEDKLPNANNEEEREEQSNSGSEGHLLGKFAWGKYDNYHDIGLVQLNDFKDCNCQISDIDHDKVATKEEIGAELEKSNPKVQLIVEKTGFRTGTTRGILYKQGYCSLKSKKGPKLKQGYLVINENADAPFAKPGDSGALVKLVRADNTKLPFAYLTFSRKQKINRKLKAQEVYFCFSLDNSLKYCKERSNDSVEECLIVCGQSRIESSA